MRFFCRITLFVPAVFLLFALNQTNAPSAELIREPVWAGRFYPASATDLRNAIHDLTRRARGSAFKIPSNKKLKALILPHAGYVYSGWTAAHAAHILEKERFTKVVLLGPDHRVGFRNGAVSDARAWETPLGLVKIHRDADRLREHGDLFRTVPSSDRVEHSLEVILPFLQVYQQNFKLVPITLGPGNIEQLASGIEPLRNENTLLVISSDLSHYLPYDRAVDRDKETIRMILDLNSEKLAKRDNSACGKIPILVALNLAIKHNWEAYLVHYSNSGDTAGAKDRVVGYAAIAFYGESMETIQENRSRFSEDDGRVLVRLARRAIVEKLGKPDDSTADLEARSSGPDFDTRLGTFVTLKINGRLRGCIGSLTGVEPIRDGVRTNAVNAAFRDPRFTPLSAEELDKVEIEVSILTEPRQLEFEGSRDLVAKLRAHVDGVIIQKGSARATFLPQVWEQLPGPELFLSHLCVKAGLSSDAWKQPGMDVFTYQVQYFEEQ